MKRLSFEPIQQGKSNKVIAYELNMCESTVEGPRAQPHEENEGEEFGLILAIQDSRIPIAASVSMAA